MAHPPVAADPPRVETTLVTSSELILPGLRETLAERAERYLIALGVVIIKGTRVTGVTPSGAGEGDEYGGNTMVVLHNGQSIKADVYIPCGGTTPNTGFVRDTKLLAAHGRVETNPRTLRVDTAGTGARIYAIGDASNFAKAGVHNTLSGVPILGANIKRDLMGAEDGEDGVFEEDVRETQHLHCPVQ
jgi:apoptosis-inducing factor 2